ncbi:MAG: UTP--glucose-1-phosphate uridylyltransferase [Chloroflexi bacterium]|nr:UTP--glucose-1-phosphate uridylyltransferase [Chloroflexota bacterium]
MGEVIALILAAGWGTRLLPVTKAVPKEMLPLVDRPIIQYALEEAVASGIRHAVVVTARGKGAIEDYFDRLPELEQLLEHRGEAERLASVRRVVEGCQIAYVRQQEQRGIADAVYAARYAVGARPFALYFPDDVILAATPVTQQLLAVYQQHQASVLAVEQVRREDVPRYGMIDAEPVGERLFRVRGLVEKPRPEEAPSEWGIVGRYVLTPGIFAAIEQTPPGANGELQITDAIQRLLGSEPVYALAFTGDRYDTGNPVGYLRASVALALQRPDLALQVREALAALLRRR